MLLKPALKLKRESIIKLRALLLSAFVIALPACTELPADDVTQVHYADFDQYYADAKGKKGSELKSALNLIIRDHVKLSYSEVWQELMLIDEDPHEPSNIILFYSGRSVDKQFNSGLENSGDAWNREHVWPKSHGFPNQSQHAYTDLHHLRPVDASINSTRSNKDFDVGGTAIDEAPENFRDSDSFEPRDSVKGDVARMIFYMDVRYQGDDDSGTPDLFLVDYSNTESGQPVLGKLCTLLDWHIQDPVSNAERVRNQMIYDVQGNRNPFIDEPNWIPWIYAHFC